MAAVMATAMTVAQDNLGVGDGGIGGWGKDDGQRAGRGRIRNAPMDEWIDTYSYRCRGCCGRVEWGGGSLSKGNEETMPSFYLRWICFYSEAVCFVCCSEPKTTTVLRQIIIQVHHILLIDPF